MSRDFAHYKSMKKFALLFIAFALLVQTASALEGVEVTKLYVMGGCYDEYGAQINFIKPGEKIR